MNPFSRGFILLFVGIVVIIVSVGLLDVLLSQEITLLKDNELSITLSPGDNISRGFETTGNDPNLAFFIDYEPRGVLLNLSIENDNGKTVIDETLNNYFATIYNLDVSNYYVATLSNIGNENVEIYDIAIQNEPVFNENGDLVHLASELPVLILSVLSFVGFILMPIGILFIFINMKKGLK